MQSVKRIATLKCLIAEGLETLEKVSKRRVGVEKMLLNLR